MGAVYGEDDVVRVSGGVVYKVACAVCRRKGPFNESKGWQVICMKLTKFLRLKFIGDICHFRA